MKRLIYLLMPVLMAMVSVSCGREPLPQGQDGKDPVLETMEATGVSQTKATLNAKLEMDGVQYAELVCGFKLGTSDRRLDQFLSCEKTGDAYSTSLSALTDKTRQAVFVYRDGKLEHRAVVTGRDDGDYVEILGGLEPGEIVIVFGTENLQDGLKAEVKLRGEQDVR